MHVIVNGLSRDVAEKVTVAELLTQLKLRSPQVAVEVNRMVVSRDRHQTHVIKPNDTIEIVTLVGGGSE